MPFIFLVTLVKLFFSYLHILIHKIEILCDFFWDVLAEHTELDASPSLRCLSTAS